MTFEVLRDFETETPSGTIKLKEGQKVKLSKEEAILLIEEGTIAPIEKVAYKIYSDILETYLWVVEPDQDMHSLKSQGITEAIYTADEIKRLRGMSKDSLKAIQQVKQVFDKSNVEEVK